MHLRTLHQINVRNTHVAENLHFVMQSTCPGVLTGENYIGVVLEQYLKLDPRSESTTLSTTILTIIPVDKYNLYNFRLGD